VKVRAGPAVAAAALLGVLGLAVIPAQAYRDQQQHREELAATVSRVSSENQALRERSDRLATDDEIERLARLRYNLAKPGEEVYAILPHAPPPPPPPAAAPAEEDRRSWLGRAWDRVSSLF
jgi:cell division protein FtsB